MSEWMAPNRNFYSLALCILDSTYSADKSLIYFGIRQNNKKQSKVLEERKKRVKVEFDREELRILYEDKKLTQGEIAKIYGVVQNTISKKLREYNIATRDKTTATILSYERKGFYE